MSSKLAEKSDRNVGRGARVKGGRKVAKGDSVVLDGARKVVLENGLRLITEHIPSVRSISVGFWILGGSQVEKVEESGITHFIEHMLFKGTPTRTAYDIAKDMDSLGGHLDAFTSREYTCLLATVMDDHLSKVIDILTDQLKNSLFDEQEIDREKDVILEEIKMIEDSPDELVHDLGIENLWPGQPLGRSIIGCRESVQRFTRKELFGYFEQNYVPEEIIITAAGNVCHDSLFDLIQKRNFSATVSSRKKVDNMDRPTAHHQITYVSKKLEQVHVCLALDGLPQNHSLRFASYLMNSILGGGMSSRLFQKIREQRGLAYSVYSSFHSYQDAGFVSIYAGVRPKSFHDTIQLILEELTTFKEQEVTLEELQRAKDQLKGSLMLGLESTANRMSKLARQEIYFKENLSINQLLTKIDAVTQEDILSLARLLFRTENVSLTVLGDISGQKLTLEDLRC
jgi:predicted Zn-dependent peptidase